MKPVEDKNIVYVFDKLYNTIETYKEKYPELIYLEKEFNDQPTVTESKNFELEKLIKLCGWLKELVMQYYVFRIIQYRLEQDIAGLQQGNFQRSKNRFYLEFAEN